MAVARQLVEYVGRAVSFRRSGTNLEIVSARPSPPSAHQLLIVSIDVLDRDAKYTMRNCVLDLTTISGMFNDLRVLSQSSGRINRKMLKKRRVSDTRHHEHLRLPVENISRRYHLSRRLAVHTYLNICTCRNCNPTRTDLVVCMLYIFGECAISTSVIWLKFNIYSL